MHTDNVRRCKEDLTAFGHINPFGGSPRATFRGRPPLYLHPDRFSIACDGLGDAPVTVEAERAAPQSPPYPHLPPAAADGHDLLRDLPVARQEQR